MKRIQKNIIAVGVVLLSAVSAIAQEGIGTNTPDKSAALEVSSSKRGLLIPRVNLKGTDDVTTIASPANSLLVYNLTARGAATDSNRVEVGYYYWSQPSNKWVKLSTDIYTAGQGMILNDTEFSRTGLEEITESGKTGWALYWNG